MSVPAIDVYINQNYSSILETHNMKYLPTHRHCLAVCAIDQSCAAVSYDRVTSTCKMSETPSVIVNSTDTEKTASVKQIHSGDTQIYEFSMLLARGEKSFAFSYVFYGISSNIKIFVFVFVVENCYNLLKGLNFRILYYLPNEKSQT